MLKCYLQCIDYIFMCYTRMFWVPRHACRHINIEHDISLKNFNTRCSIPCVTRQFWVPRILYRPNKINLSNNNDN